MKAALIDASSAILLLKAEVASDRLLHLGRYSRWVVAYARSCSARDLNGFLPVPEKPSGPMDKGGAVAVHLLNN